MKTILYIFLITMLFSCKGHSDNTESSNDETENIDVKTENINSADEKLVSTDNAEIPAYVEEEQIAEEKVEKKDCSEAKSNADDAYTYCRRAYNSDYYEEVKSYLKKAMNRFEDAISSAEDCECDDAKYSADEGYTYAKKGYNSDDFDEMKDFARKAKNSADDTMSKANSCTE